MSAGKIVVGISGVTNGGKSFLCNTLLSLFPRSKLILQDDYFYPEGSPAHIPSASKYGHHNWDVISGIDMDSMVDDVHKELSCSQGFGTLQDCDPPWLHEIKQDFTSEVNSIVKGLRRTSNEFLILDGFLLFDDPRIHQLCDIKIFLTLSKEECLVRRLSRHYDPPDPPDYFETCVWPMYELHLAGIKKLYQDIMFLDGKISKETALLSTLTCILDKVV